MALCHSCHAVAPVGGSLGVRIPLKGTLSCAVFCRGKREGVTTQNSIIVDEMWEIPSSYARQISQGMYRGGGSVRYENCDPQYQNDDRYSIGR